MTYEIWDLTTRNVAGCFRTKDEALESVRRTVERHGREYAKGFLLMSENAKEVSRSIAEGEDLIDLALASAVPSKPTLMVVKQQAG